MNTSFKIGYSFSEKRMFTEHELKKFAKDCGDMNPVHHDSDFANNTRFSSIIASGSALSAIFSAMIPSHFCQFSPMLGLEMSFQFLNPVKPHRDILMTWRITKIISKTSTDQLIELLGEITDHEGKALITSSAKVILLPEL